MTLIQDQELRISFPAGNIINLPNASCECPRKLLVQVSGLTIGKKYTVFTSAINDANVEHTIFPESYSFVAKSKELTLSFYYQFVFD